MKNKILKRVFAFAMTAAVIAGSAMPAMAATLPADGKISTSDTTLIIPKGVVMHNDIEGQYYGPTINFTYTIAPETPATPATPTGAKPTVTDADPDTGVVQTGVADGVTISTMPSLTSSKLNMNQAGVETQNTGGLVLAADASKFSKPGIYRYKITDTTTDAALYAAGITRGSAYQDDRWLDLYIERNAAEELVVAGYVLLKTNDPTVTTQTGKSQGYIQADNLGTDDYYTYNVTLAKDVEGAMGDRTHEFPFDITINNDSKTYMWQENGTDNMAETALTSATLKHGDVINIRGLSPRAKVSYTETIDVNDIYDVSVTGAEDAVLVASTAKGEGETTVLSASDVSTYLTANSATSVATTPTATNVSEVTYVNTMDTVSPTGVLLRFAPYLFMLFAGIVLFGLSRRQRTIA